MILHLYESHTKTTEFIHKCINILHNVLEASINTNTFKYTFLKDLEVDNYFLYYESALENKSSFSAERTQLGH